MKTISILAPKNIAVIILATFILTACTTPNQSAEMSQPELVQSDPPAGSLLSVANVTSEPVVEKELEILEDSINVEKKPNDLSDKEVADLIFMREEEKLAHDVYLVLFELWELPLFQNIARSEEAHSAAVKRLLNTFNIPDPADDTPPGIFNDPALQNLYNELITQGERSLMDALKVGAAIEEIDILDLVKALENTDNASIQRVYKNLLRGSENHLRSFTSTLLRQTGETYQPQYLDLDSFSEILTSEAAKGGRNNNNRP